MLTTTKLNKSDIEALRADFSILATQVNGRPLTYLDSGATSQKPRVVLDAERELYKTRNSAAHRGAHTLAALETEGHHCAQPLHRRLELTASTRASGSIYTTTAEIDYFLQSVADARSFFGVAS